MTQFIIIWETGLHLRQDRADGKNANAVNRSRMQV